MSLAYYSRSASNCCQKCVVNFVLLQVVQFKRINTGAFWLLVHSQIIYASCTFLSHISFEDQAFLVYANIIALYFIVYLYFAGILSQRFYKQTYKCHSLSCGGVKNGL